ncbi:MAG: FHA domain-containing protein [Gammaproteobacteria bacterium]|nr:FHA domain-containing protein [Gammaproteobacteria bacterium]
MSGKAYIIGRAGDITLYDDTVSRQHASLEIEDDRLYLKDLDSRNGTYEIREKKLVPFTAGLVTSDQVFAFGECVRSVAQLLKMIESATDGSPTMGDGNEDDPLDATQIGFSIAPRKRLTSANIIEMLEHAEDDAADGKSLHEICETLGITKQRYERWCKEYGETRAEREETTVALRRENERLRKIVADLSLERDVLKDASRPSSETTGDDPDNPASPNLSIVSDSKP